MILGLAEAASTSLDTIPAWWKKLFNKNEENDRNRAFTPS